MAISLIPAASAINGTLPAANLPAGSVLQVVQSPRITSSTSTTSSSFVATNLTATITPKFSTSKILVMYNTSVDTQGAPQQGLVTVYRGSTNIVDSTNDPTGNGFGGAYAASTRLQVGNSGCYLDSPATTSATTYTVYGRSTGGTILFNVTVNGFITLMEIAA